MELKGKSSGFLSNVKALPDVSRNLKQEIERFIAITELLDTLGYKYEIDFTSIKGFEYYTGLCFKITSGGSRVCSGGRYDNLIGLVGGMEKPACGFAFYVDRWPLWSSPDPSKSLENRHRANTGQEPGFYQGCLLCGCFITEGGTDSRAGLQGSQMNARWTVNIQTRPRTYIVRDAVRDAEKTVADIKDIINS
jgi:hypothetical protein